MYSVNILGEIAQNMLNRLYVSIIFAKIYSVGMQDCIERIKSELTINAYEKEIKLRM